MHMKVDFNMDYHYERIEVCKMYCRNCGKEIDEKAVICPHCGVAVNGMQPNAPQMVNIEDNGNTFGWGVLGCLVPIAGLVLYLIWKDAKPRTAKAAGIGAIVCVAILIVLYALIFFSAMFMSFGRVGQELHYF